MGSAARRTDDATVCWVGFVPFASMLGNLLWRTDRERKSMAANVIPSMLPSDLPHTPFSQVLAQFGDQPVWEFLSIGGGVFD